jgi:L-glutamine-phosphate cytidylyltransferase
MKHIILAAGMGKRLLPLTMNLPKPLVEVGFNVTFLDVLIQHSLSAKQVNEVIVVVGHGAQLIEEKVKEKYPNQPIALIYNPKYEINNPILSLEAAADVIQKDDFFITNGDTLYRSTIVARLMDWAPTGVTVVASPIKEGTTHHMAIEFTGNQVTKVFPSAEPKSDGLESAGLVLVKGEHSREIFVNAIKSLSEEYKDKSHYWHDILNVVSKNVPVHILRVGSEDWYEVDTPADLELLQQKVQKLRFLP